MAASTALRRLRDLGLFTMNGSGQGTYYTFVVGIEQKLSEGLTPHVSDLSEGLPPHISPLSKGLDAIPKGFPPLADEIKKEIVCLGERAGEEGRAWHKQHGLKTWADRKPFKINCLFCDLEIETKTYNQKFCDQNCKKKYGRKIRRDQKNTET